MDDGQAAPESEPEAEAVPDGGAPAAAPNKKHIPVFEPLGWGVLGAMLLIASLIVAETLGRVPGTLLGLAGLASAAWALIQSGRLVVREDDPLRALAGLLQGLAALGLSLLGMIIVAMDSAGGFRRGRQLRSLGRLKLPPLGRGTGWATLPSDACAAPDPERLAAQWRENGRTEHASVAAFARLSLDLLGLGAPARLLRQAQADALDEIRHAELCFSLARDLDGKDLEPVAFAAAARSGPRSRLRSVALVQVAIDSLVEGALHEGLSARVVAQLGRAGAHPRIQPLLVEIARDEGRHAAHAWDVLEWCLAEGGFAVQHALRGALQALPEVLETELPEAAWSGAWADYGIHGKQLEAQAYAEALASVRCRAEKLIAAPLVPVAA